MDRTALEDDLYGQIAMRVRQMAPVAKQHLDSHRLRPAGPGFVTVGYDGVPFFGTHPRAAAQSNKGTEALSAPGLQDAITAMMRFKDDQGRPAGYAGPAGRAARTVLGGADAAELGVLPGPGHGRHQQLGANPLNGLLRW